MDEVTLTNGLVRINDRLAAIARRERSPVTFMCECGSCWGIFVPLSLEQFDQLRARDEPVLVPGHN